MILGIAGKSESGKTTLITELVSELKAKGLSVVVIKHIHQEGCLIPEGKDTTRYLDAGGDYSLGVSPNELVVYSRGDGSLRQALKMVDVLGRPNILLIEGFKDAGIPKVVIGDVEAEGPVLLRYDEKKGNVKDVLNLIERELGLSGSSTPPGANTCVRCEMGRGCIRAKAKQEDRKSDSSDRLEILADGKRVDVSGFPSRIVSDTIDALISSLKGTEGIDTIEIKLRRR